ncbi:MAG TPA: class I SAM-dependent methyltransferase [Actinomycetota bacterium]|nr:class I SAM-dependent methyltransferase [Actinomycetota bacterium]
MKLNWFGRMQMNNPARAAAQRRFTAKHMLRLGGAIEGGNALEIGCGRGVGVEIIVEQFRAANVVAFDIDRKLVALAERRTARLADRVKLSVGSATNINARDSSFDAVFDFGVIHQIDEWQTAVSECARVLRPHGRFYFEAVSSPFYRLPMNLAMARGNPDVRKIGFNRDAYLSELDRNGIHVGTNYIEPRLPITAAFVGDLIGVGRLNPS